MVMAIEMVGPRGAQSPRFSGVPSALLRAGRAITRAQLPNNASELPPRFRTRYWRSTGTCAVRPACSDNRSC